MESLQYGGGGVPTVDGGRGLWGCGLPGSGGLLLPPPLEVRTVSWALGLRPGTISGALAGLGLTIPTFCGRLLGWPGAERPSVPRPEPGRGDPLISLLLVSLQWSGLFGLYPVSALYRLLLVEGPRASHKAPAVEEGRWAPPPGPLPRVLSSLPLAAWFCPT